MVWYDGVPTLTLSGAAVFLIVAVQAERCRHPLGIDPIYDTITNVDPREPNESIR